LKTYKFIGSIAMRIAGRTLFPDQIVRMPKISHPLLIEVKERKRTTKKKKRKKTEVKEDADS
jgi:hypothetical protein